MGWGEGAMITKARERFHYHCGVGGGGVVMITEVKDLVLQ